MKGKWSAKNQLQSSLVVLFWRICTNLGNSSKEA